MNRRERVTKACFYIFVTVLFLLPILGMGEPIKQGGKPSLEMLGFYTEAEGQIPSSFSTLEANSDNFTFIAPFYYRLGDNNSPELQGVGQDQVKMLIEYAHRRNVKVLALVHNLMYGIPGVGKEKAHDILKDSSSRKRFAGEITELVDSSGFDGVMLDIEDIRNEDKDNFSDLVREIKYNFSRSNLTLGVAVPPETGEFIEGSWAINFDYAAIGRWADRIIVMTYDEHGYSTLPGPVASREWVKRVVNYSISSIPKEKIMLGIPGYGFDWEEDKPGPRYLSHRLATDIARSEQVEPVFSQEKTVPVFRYIQNGKEHQVWFEDTRSFAVKVKIAEQYGLKGLALWRMGMEDPRIWSYIDENINVVK